MLQIRQGTALEREEKEVIQVRDGTRRRTDKKRDELGATIIQRYVYEYKEEGIYKCHIDVIVQE